MAPDGKWVAVPWVKDSEDAGLVIVDRLPGGNAVDIVMFGFSARATSAMAETIVPNADPLWPPYYEWQGRELGIYICRFTEAGPSPAASGGTYGPSPPEIIQLEPSILDRFLQA
jgi:hypothetical protein